MTITANYCTDMLRRRLSLKRMVQQVSLDVVDFRVFDADANPEGSALRNEQRDRVRQALQQIPEKYREVLLLFYWNDLSYNEIVEVTGLKESTIKTRLHRARAQLLEVLEQPTV
jgi:RNA polymerase sigma-70 factor (ECF subfamily)